MPVPVRFFEELRHRNIVRVGVLYLAVCWVILEPVHVVFHMLEVPLWANQLVLIVMAVGFPAVLLFAWVFELTPDGIRPTVLVDPRKSIRPLTGRRLDRAIIVVLALALSFVVAQRLWIAPPGTAPLRAPGAATTVPAPAAAPSPPAPAVAITTPQVPAVGAPAVPVGAPPGKDPGSRLAQGSATLTILEGPALFIRGALRYVAAEGVKIESGDVVATGAGGFLQLEFDGGTRVELGPQTQMLLLDRGGEQAHRGAYLLDGWLKVTAGKQAAGEFQFVRTDGFELSVGSNVVVVRAVGDETEVFAESGNVRLIEGVGERSSAEPVVSAGQYYVHKSRRAGIAGARPSPEFLAQVPHSFRDTLPSRMDTYASRIVVARPAPDFSFAEVEPWLKTEGSIRRQLAGRWKVRLHDPAFRRSVEANLRELPDWVPLLGPPGPSTAPGAAPADRLSTTPPPS